MKNNKENFNEYISGDNNQSIDPERLNIENIEHICLEKKSNKYKRSAILFGIAAGIWGLCAILNSTRLLALEDPSFRLQLKLLLDLSCFGFYGMSSYDSYNSMKKTNKKIEETRVH